MGKSVSLAIGTWSIGDVEVVVFKIKRSVGLPGVELFYIPDVDEVLVVLPDQEWLKYPYEPLAPLHQGLFDWQ